MAFRWAIASTGNIADSFARALSEVPEADLVAVGSRSTASAARFAAEHRVPRVHGSIEALADDPDIDIVYVAGIHPVHRDHAVAMMEAGKHVLVEKPLAMSVDEVDQMTEVSRRTGRFLMEAMWMRFNPLHVALKERLDAGEFGTVRSITSDFSFVVPHDPAHRLFDPVKGGGAILDVGIYPLTLACWWLGHPASTEVAGRRGDTGVDVEVALDMEWGNGARARLTCGIQHAGSMESVIMCEDAEILIPGPSHASHRAQIRRRDEVESLECAPASLHHQVHEVHDCVTAGRNESPRMSHADSRAVMSLMEEIIRRV